MKILVTYSSFVGSTAEVAEAVSQGLAGIGETAGTAAEDGNLSIDVLPMKQVEDLSQYGAVVLGSAVRYGRLHPGTINFIEKHRDRLRAVPVALFVVCLTMKDPTSENRATVKSYLDPVRERFPEISPVSVGLFAGLMDYKKLPLAARLIAKGVKAPEGDFRQWEAITEWAQALGMVRRIYAG